MSTTKVIFWSCFGILLGIGIHSLREQIAPFFIAFVLAYILDPIIRSNCQRFKLSRTLAATFVFILFLGLFILVTSLLAPLIYSQLATLVSKIPHYRDYLQGEIAPLITQKFKAIDPSITAKISSAIQNFVSSTLMLMARLFDNLWYSAKATINLIIITLLVPIILFYLLRDWDRVKKCLYDLLPLKHRDEINNMLKELSGLLSAYVRGQLNICLILSVLYGSFLSLIGLDLGLLIGVLSGFLVIIPLIGNLISFSLALIVGYVSFGLNYQLLYIAILYPSLALLENYFLTPKIIGDRIGLHPLWIMFSVFASGAIFGFVGIFFAVPIAGIIKVLLKYTIKWYKTSSFYKS